MTNIGDIFAFVTKIYLKSTRSCEIWRYFVEIYSRFDGSGQILAKFCWIRRNFGTDSETRKLTGASPKTNEPEPDDLTINTGWFRFLFSPTWTIQVELGLGTNLNRTTWPLIWVDFCFDFHPPEQFRLGLSQA